MHQFLEIVVIADQTPSNITRILWHTVRRITDDFLGVKGLIDSFQILASSGIWCVFYFLGGIFFCSFYLLNLVLAVVALSYELEIKSIHKEVSSISLSKPHELLFIITIRHFLNIKRINNGT